MKKIYLNSLLITLLLVGLTKINETKGQVSKWDYFDNEIGFGSFHPFGWEYDGGSSTDFVLTYKKSLGDRISFNGGLAFGFSSVKSTFSLNKSRAWMLDGGIDFRLVRRQVFFNLGPTLGWGFWRNVSSINGNKINTYTTNLLGIGPKATLGVRITEAISFNVAYGELYGFQLVSNRDHLSDTSDITSSFSKRREVRKFSTTLSIRF